MRENLIVGLVTMVVCLTIQCFVVAYLVHVFLVVKKKWTINLNVAGGWFLLVGVMVTMFVANLLQMVIWAGIFVAYGEFADFTTAFYHSVVNFSTLGYGDIVMSPERRLLGALESANGSLMLGLTAGLLFAILSTLAQQIWETKSDTDESGQSAIGGTRGMQERRSYAGEGGNKMRTIFLTGDLLFA
jgi:hypothetical protein